MNQEEFMCLVWRFDEILMHRDYLNQQIDRCGGKCGEEDEGLCPDCCEIFMQVQREDDRLAGNQELAEILKKLKQACDEDKTGEYQRIMDQPRGGKVFH